MESKFDLQSNERSFPAAAQDKLYAKFRALGANVERLRELGLAVPKLELLLECLEPMHDKKLVRFLTGLGRSPPELFSKKSASVIMKKVIKTCPRCTRELTDTNVIKETTYHHNDFVGFVVVCECCYIRELKKPADSISERQSTLQEY